ncbi:hypothetical protein AMK24_20680 [Streptomyces sp. CB02366]|nr:hypothetical protein AMK24_20680 [Streptomyces sp. CB02366]
MSVGPALPDSFETGGTAGWSEPVHLHLSVAPQRLGREADVRPMLETARRVLAELAAVLS